MKAHPARASVGGSGVSSTAPATATTSAEPAQPRTNLVIAASVAFVLGCAVYYNALDGRMVFDDLPAIAEVRIGAVWCKA